MNNTNYELLTVEPLIDIVYDCGEPVQNPHFEGSKIYTYRVTNPAWNNALNDTARHTAFYKYVDNVLYIPIMNLEKDKDGRFIFTAFDC